MSWCCFRVSPGLVKNSCNGACGHRCVRVCACVCVRVCVLPHNGVGFGTAVSSTERELKQRDDEVQRVRAQKEMVEANRAALKDTITSLNDRCVRACVCVCVCLHVCARTRVCVSVCSPTHRPCICSSGCVTSGCVFTSQNLWPREGQERPACAAGSNE